MHHTRRKLLQRDRMQRRVGLLRVHPDPSMQTQLPNHILVHFTSYYLVTASILRGFMGSSGCFNLLRENSATSSGIATASAAPIHRDSATLDTLLSQLNNRTLPDRKNAV